MYIDNLALFINHNQYLHIQRRQQVHSKSAPVLIEVHRHTASTFKIQFFQINK